MVTKECFSCKYQGTMGELICCDYCWITGKCRTKMERSADGKCPVYEEGERYRVEVRPMDRPFRAIIIKGNSISHEQLMALWQKGMTDGEIASEVGSVKSTIYKWRQRNHLAPNGLNTNGKIYDYAKFRELWEQGLSDTKIGKECGCAGSTVGRWRQQHGLESKGISGHLPILDREKMRELYDAGMSDERIAREMGCNSSTVGKWRARNDLPANGRKEMR